MSPKVSIIIPCYNSEQWVEKSIMSALNQDYENLEVIAVDNESTDKTYSILEKIKKEHNQLILLTAENIYPNCWDEARAEAYKVLSGDYFTVIGSDDYIDSSYISNCMKIIMKAPDKILAMQSPLMGIEGDTNALRGVIEHHYSSLKNFKEQSLNKCLVNSTTVIYNTSLLKDGLLKTNPEKYGGAADYDLYCSLADNGIMIYPFPKWIGFYYRWHKDQATWKVHKEAKNYDKMIQDYWRGKWKN